MRIHPEEDKIKWDHLTDNRDLAVVVRWDPTSVNATDGEAKSEPSMASTKEMAVESFNQDRELLRLRVGLMHLTASCVNLLTNREGTKDARLSGTHKTLHDAWRDLFKHAREANYKPLSDQYLVNILPSRLHAILALPYEDTFYALSDFVGCVFHGAENPKSRADTLSECLRSVASRLELEITSHNQQTDLIWNRRVIQERVVNCIEILSLCSFVLVCGYERFSRAGGVNSHQGSKKNKKREVAEGNGGESVIGGAGQVAEKERLVAIVDVLKGLRDQLSICDLALGE